MKNDFQAAKTRSSPSCSLRCLFSLLSDVVAIQLPSCLCSADLSICIILCCYCYWSEKKKTYFWSWRVETDKQSHSPHSKLSEHYHLWGMHKLVILLWRLAVLGSLLYFSDITADFKLNVGEDKRFLAMTDTKESQMKVQSTSCLFDGIS